ncbi:hypothetical protein WISP_20518 [Willisornis vidua]|uniref:Uncharacterized protein n=1 Tax=Willisornis vidua TaxID=1566151 RepID=A0ABQ9DNA1_9PASS|nr:hypothetical protein WISP_20518 [Willisornis vidua]
MGLDHLTCCFQLDQLAVIRDWQWECENQRRKENSPPSEVAQTCVDFTQSSVPNLDPCEAEEDMMFHLCRLI